MRFVVTYTGRTLEFLELEERTLHLRPRRTLELTQSELDEIKKVDPDLFGMFFVHEMTENQKKKSMLKRVVEKPVKKPVGRPTKKSKKESDPDKP